MQERLTPYSELDVVLKDHGQRIRDVLGDNFVGLYLNGSLAIGDFDLTSDVDFIVVIKDDLSEKQVKDIQEAHLQTYGQDNRWVRRMEYSFFPEQVLRQKTAPFKYSDYDALEDRKLWYFDNGRKTIKRSEHDNSLVVRWTVREKGKAVFGPDPKTLIDPINPDDLRIEIKSILVGWGEDLIEDPAPFKNRFYQAYLVLNYCRMLKDLHEGRVTSKLEGVNWAKVNLDPKWRPLIDFCWEERQDTEISVKQPANEEVFERTMEFVKYVVAEGKRFTI